MKKMGLLLFTLFLSFTLMACSRSLSLNVPDGSVIEVTLQRNVLLGEPCSDYDTQYEPIVLTDQADIDALFEEINSWRVREEKRINYDICGFGYVISWDTHSINIVTDEHFYYRGKLYELQSGSLDYLDAIEFTAIHE